jgi:Glycosyl hydrolase family 9
MQLPKPEEGWTLFNSNRPNANSLTGALVGGPGAGRTSRGPGDVFVDKRSNGDGYEFAHARNEVALDYNAALLLALIQTCK